MLLDKISDELCLPATYLRFLSLAASHHYKEFQIPKRTSGYRTIHHPSKQLKSVQRWLLRRVVINFPVHDRALAYRKNIGIFRNAELHKSSRFLLRMDFEKFFPSLTAGDIRSYIRHQDPGGETWSDEDIDIFCKFVCRYGALTIGAPSSPALSNAVCFELDERLFSFAQRLSVTYTRYADDLFFSTSAPNVLKRVEQHVFDVCDHLSWPANLKINLGKTRHLSKKHARRVTGLTLGSDEVVHLGRNLKRRIRSMIHQFDALDPAEQAKLRGLLAFATSIDGEFLNSLILKYSYAKIRRVQSDAEPA